MTLSNGFLMSAILVMMIATQLTRVTPFVIWRKHKPPKVIDFLGKFLGTGIIALLVVYSFRNTTVLTYPYGLPQLITALVVFGLHKWRHNMLISIFGGTALYMFLLQVVFA